jgi:hypothetical protein
MPRPSKRIVFLWCRYQKPVCPLFYPTHVTCFAHLIRLDSVTSKYNIIAAYGSRRSLLCHFLQFPVTLCLLEPNICLRTLLLKSSFLYVSIIVKDQVSHASQTTGTTVMPYNLKLMFQIVHEKANVVGLNSGRNCPNLFCTWFLYPLNFDGLCSLSNVLTLSYVQSILFLSSYCNFYSELRSRSMNIHAVLWELISRLMIWQATNKPRAIFFEVRVFSSEKLTPSDQAERNMYHEISICLGSFGPS